MDNTIKELYKKAQLSYDIKRCREYCISGDYHGFTLKWKEIQESIAEFCRFTTTNNAEIGMQLWDSMVEISNYASSGNWNKVIDIIEESASLFYRAISLLGKIDFVVDGYQYFSSNSGFLTVKELDSEIQMTSEIDPMWNAFEKAKKIYIPTMERFATIGVELGYLCNQIYEVSHESVEIYIYNLKNVINDVEFALEYGVLSLIPSEKLHIIECDSPEQLIEEFAVNLDYYKESKAILNIEPYAMRNFTGETRSIAEVLKLSINSTNTMFSISEQNYYLNRKSVNSYILELKDTYPHSTCIVVGGGPSVDYNLEYLRESQKKNKIIIAVTTVYELLVSEGIIPDYIVALDPQNRTFGHIHSLELKSTLILGDVANWQFAKKCKGKKYLVPLEGFFFSEDVYKEQNLSVWCVRSTVTSMAVEIAIYLGADSIELVGVDLAYTSESSHAKGTMDNQEIKTTNLRRINGINGSEVYTDDRFTSYVREIESIIDQNQSVTYYNRSKNGAIIRGCKNVM